MPIKIAFLFNKCVVLDKKYTFLSSLLNLLGVFVTSLGLKDRNEIAVFETIVKISEKCQETNKSVTPYKIDKILW